MQRCVWRTQQNAIEINMYFMLDATITFHNLCIGPIKSFNLFIEKYFLKNNQTCIVHHVVMIFPLSSSNENHNK
jgi:hypothetical protein